MTTETLKKPIANQMIVLREEFDDWAILFDPDTGKGFGLNPVSVYIWKQLDGKHTCADIAKKMPDLFNNVPDVALDHVNTFVDSLVEKGLAGFEVNA